MNLIIFITLLFGLQAIYWVVGKRASKNLKNDQDYFLAGKNIRFFPLMMTFLATQVGGGLVLGAADEAYRFGWPVLLYPLGAAVGLIMLGMGLGKKLAQFQVSTVAQILEVVYRSPGLRKVASLLSVISLFMILVAQIIASNKFLVSLGFSNTALFVLFWAIVILYTVRGGLKAVIATDIVQATFFSVVFFLCFGFVFYSDPGSFFQAPLVEKFAGASSKLCGWLLMPLMFMIIEQDMAQRCFAGGSPQIVSRASFWAGVFTLLICLIPIFFGVLAKSMGLVIPEGESVLMTVIEKTTNPWVTAFVGCAVLAAIISTASSLINAICSNLASDFFKREKTIPIVQGITAVTSIGALFFAFYFNNVVDLLIQSYELSVSCLFVPILAALFKRQGNFRSALLSIVFGALGFCFFRFVPLEFFPREIASVALSFAGYIVGERMVARRAA